MEEVADIGKDAATGALEVAAREEQVEVSRDIQGALKGKEELPDSISGPIMVVEEKVPLRSDASY